MTKQGQCGPPGRGGRERRGGEASVGGPWEVSWWKVCEATCCFVSGFFSPPLLLFCAARRLRVLSRALTCGRVGARAPVRASDHGDGSPHPAGAPLCPEACLSCVHTSSSSLICASFDFTLLPLSPARLPRPAPHLRANDVVEQKPVRNKEKAFKSSFSLACRMKVRMKE